MSEYPVRPLASEQYAFVDRTKRSSGFSESITDYEYDPLLGNDIEATVVVKWDNQREHDDNLRVLGRVGWDVARGHALAPSPRDRHRYYGGYVVRTLLDCDTLSRETVTAQPVLQPTGVTVRQDGTTVYASGNRLLVSPDGDVNNVSATIDNPMFARLHSVAFSEDGNRILTASSSLDMLYELRVEDGSVAWAMDLWAETPHNTNILGQSFYRSQKPETAGFLLNPSSFDLKDNEQLRDAECVVDDPSAYKWLGLATALTPVFINAVDYESNDVILATSFGRGEAWRVDREKRQIEVIAKDLGRPHGLHVNRGFGGYLLSDTLNEKVIFLDENLGHERVLDLSQMGERKEGIENSRWLQYTTELQPGVYCAAMTSRQRLTLFNPSEKTRRDIVVDPDWGVQMVIPASRA